MSKRKCGLCGKDPAEGFASINDVFYCHGDDDLLPTCYMQSQREYLIAHNHDPIEIWETPHS